MFHISNVKFFMLVLYMISSLGFFQSINNSLLKVKSASLSYTTISSLPITSASVGYRDIACSANGQYVYTSVYGSGFYYSSNNGSTWTGPVTFNGGYNDITGIACDVTGQSVFFSINLGGNNNVFYSLNYGVTFTQITGFNQNVNTGVGCSYNTSTSTFYACAITYSGQFWWFKKIGANAITSTQITSGVKSNSGYLACRMSPDPSNPMIMAFGNSKSGGGSASCIMSKLSYDSNPSFVELNSGFDMNATNCKITNLQTYVPVNGYNLGVWYITSSNTAGYMTLSNRLSAFNTSYYWVSSVNEPSVNFVAVVGYYNTNTIFLYSINNGVTFSQYTLPIANVAMQLFMWSYVSGNNVIIYLVPGGFLSAGYRPIIITVAIS